MIVNSCQYFGLCVLFAALLSCYGEVGKTCQPESVDSTCGINERCWQKIQNSTGKCICQSRYHEESGICVETSTTAAASTDSTDQRKNTESSGGSVAVGLLVPTFLLLLGGLGFCVMRRYRIIPCRRNLYGNVLVTREEDDDDDPPIA